MEVRRRAWKAGSCRVFEDAERAFGRRRVGQERDRVAGDCHRLALAVSENGRRRAVRDESHRCLRLVTPQEFAERLDVGRTRLSEDRPQPFQEAVDPSWSCEAEEAGLARPRVRERVRRTGRAEHERSGWCRDVIVADLDVKRAVEHIERLQVLAVEVQYRPLARFDHRLEYAEVLVAVLAGRLDPRGMGVERTALARSQDDLLHR
jgi:hypothetical protein